ncbi:MAG: DNA alkylation repair protein, partial [Oscillospiraceae bacterium]
MTEIQKRLFELQDTEYKAFHSRLMPTVSPDRIIGVRIPELRRLAKELSGTELGDEFLQALPHFYYEENNLQGFLIEKIRDFDLCISEIDRFLPYVDNWATCDSMSPK